ncbi:hypothetical protein AX16_006045 [Volvariella volvacea WC 439]|nr:hypothetical protein AX16_006045 [Volvariella volvacea WC 439]
MAPRSTSPASSSSSSSTFIHSLPSTPKSHDFSNDFASVVIPGLPQNTYEVIAVTKARIYHAELKGRNPDWTYSTLKGVLVFGKDAYSSEVDRSDSRTKNEEFNLERFWFRLINESNGQILWLLRLPPTFRYQVDRPFFHTFQARTRKYGFLLEQDEEAQNFYHLVVSRTQPPPLPTSTTPGNQLTRSLSLTRNRSLRNKKQSPPSPTPAVPAVPPLPGSQTSSPPPPPVPASGSSPQRPASKSASVFRSRSKSKSRSATSPASGSQASSQRERREDGNEDHDRHRDDASDRYQRRSSSRSRPSSPLRSLSISAPRNGSLVHIAHVGLEDGEIKASDNLDERWRRELEEYKSRRASGGSQSRDGNQQQARVEVEQEWAQVDWARQVPPLGALSSQTAHEAMQGGSAIYQAKKNALGSKLTSTNQPTPAKGHTFFGVGHGQHRPHYTKVSERVSAENEEPKHTGSQFLERLRSTSNRKGLMSAWRRTGAQAVRSNTT